MGLRDRFAALCPMPRCTRSGLAEARGLMSSVVHHLGPRRIVAIVLPKLACEVALQRKAHQGADAQTGPLAVILSERGIGGEQLALPLLGEPASSPQVNAILSVVNDEARRYGVRPGQRVTEATALVARLAIEHVRYDEIDRALARVAEVALRYGPTASIALAARDDTRASLAPGAAATNNKNILRSKAKSRLQATQAAARSASGDGPFDTVWLDITGAAHLVGGEEALLDELGDRVAALGHTPRLAIAEGPRLAQALARWGTSGALPVHALPLAPDAISFLLRVGILTVADLRRLPPSEVLARLGPRGAEALALAEGHDPTPLLPFSPPPTLVEETELDHGVETTDALLFVMQAMTKRLEARLEARGEAAARIDATMPYDRRIAAWNAEQADRGSAPAEVASSASFQIDMPVPISGADDLFRVLRARLDRLSLAAPVVGLKLAVTEIARAERTQLDLSSGIQADPHRLPALLAELSAELGADHVGLLDVADSLLPEGRSKLVPFNTALTPPAEAPPLHTPTRLLEKPLPLGKHNASVVALSGQLYVVEEKRFAERLDDVHWWTDKPVSRDYFRVTFGSGAPSAGGGHAWGADPGAQWGSGSQASPNTRRPGVKADALVFVEPSSGEMYLQGWFE